MIEITKSEKEEIVNLFPKAHIVRTMKRRSKRHHYYCEESKPVIKYLSNTRNNREIQSILREGGSNTD